MSNSDSNTVTKICTVCNEEKSITEFNRNKNGKDGHLCQCKKCVKSLREANADKRKVYLEETKEKRRITQSEYYSANKEKLNADGKAYYILHKERIDAVNKAWSEANKERCSASQKAWRDANKERCFATRKAWRDANPEKYAVLKRNDRARRRNAPGKHTAADILNLLSLQKNKCATCKVSVSKGYHVDHVVALINGGSNDKSNLQILCPTCNMRKNSKDPIEFNQSLGLLL